MFTTIIIFIAILSILVFVHELGHFWTARRFGVQCDEFGFGFPPRAFGFYKNTDGKWKFVWSNRDVTDVDGTVYSINWLPLGGFVKIKGEQGDSKQDTDSFSHKKIWKRIIILTAGVTMNIIFAAVFLSIGFMMGLPQALDTELSDKARIESRSIQVMQVLPGSAAETAGVQMGDSIVSINDQAFATYETLQSFVGDKDGIELSYTLKRGDEILDLAITPQILENSDQAGIGIAVAETGLVSYPWYQAIWEGVKMTVLLTWFIIMAFYNLFRDLIFGQGVSAELAGPVGIAILTGQIAQLGFVYLLQFAAMLSINLAIINYLPFPALDGGRVLFLLIEKIRGKAVPEKVEAIFHNTGFLLLILLIILVTYRDVIKYIG